MQSLRLLCLAMAASVLPAQPAPGPPRRVFPIRSGPIGNGGWKARPPLWTRGRYLEAPQTTTTTGTPYVSPSQMQSIYGLSLVEYTTTIAIVDAYDSPNAESDLNFFSNNYGLPPCTTANGCFTKVDQDGKKVYPIRNSEWEQEINLDTQWVHAMAPSSNILLVEAKSESNTDLFAAVSYAKLHASVVAMSWGGPEMCGQGQYDTTVFYQAGVTFVAASGDKGDTISYPASSPNVIAVGGTSFAVNSQGYIILPVVETAWNDADGGSGGGCSLYTPQPAFQRGWLPSSCTTRGTPDVALDGDPASGVQVYISRQGGWFILGGTSLSAQLFAAIVADVNGYRTSTYFKTASPTLYMLLPQLYSLAGRSYATYFKDITGGGGPLSAGPGWDFVTGLGSPIGSMLMNYLTAVKQPPILPAPVKPDARLSAAQSPGCIALGPAPHRGRGGAGAGADAGRATRIRTLT